jgi:hypothetical protein
MARKTLTCPVQSNSRIAATTSERFAAQSQQGLHDTGRAFVRADFVEDEDNSREFDRMMRGNRGVL